MSPARVAALASIIRTAGDSDGCADQAAAMAVEPGASPAKRALYLAWQPRAGTV